MEFKENVSDWYETQVVVETPNFEKDTYGNTWYSVKFTGDAGTHLWLAKEAPTEGKKYFGHFELTKSGKAYRFKKDTVPENELAPAEANDKQASYEENPDKQNSINRAVALNNAVALLAPAMALQTEITANTLSEVLNAADNFFTWLQNDVPEVQDEGAETVRRIFNEGDL